MTKHGWSIRPWTTGDRMAGVAGEEDLQLLEPAEWMRDAYVAMADDYAAAGEDVHGQRLERAVGDFGGLLRRWRDAARGVNLGPDEIQQQTWWLVRNGREIVGVVYLRPEADAERQRKTGHVGYYVRPAERGKGYGTVMLRLAVERLRAAGVSSVAVVCGKDNEASKRVAEKNGGRLESVRFSQALNKVLHLYRIDPGADRPRQSLP
jgi:predicted acetyltransferase